MHDTVCTWRAMYVFDSATRGIAAQGRGRSCDPRITPVSAGRNDRGDTIRILSARPMTASERRDYEQQ